MIYSIVAYGDPVLRKKAGPVDADYPEIGTLVDNMFKTMYNSAGVGLAAPQIGLSIRLFVVDASPFKDDHPETDGFKRAFINAEIISRGKEKNKHSEGCLSIPGIHESIERPDKITIRYQDAQFNMHTEEYTGIIARIIQHEYDHIEGILIVDHFSPLKKSMLKGRLNDISRGKTDADYRMRFYTKK